MAEEPADRETEPPERGQLRVYLGAAPGVGKTYAMLEEGHRLRDEGHDVVVGLVETYGRAETEAQVGDLEIMLLRRIEYRGITLRELDVDRILLRRPDVVLVDELAHTNAPGSERQKRYEDVIALLDAGIDVISTLNVQHLESLNDIVQQVTGVRVRETVPDWMLDQASVELLDLPVELLRERLRAGKVYSESQAARALENYFRESNLTALRELALRRTAEGVEAVLESYLRGEGMSGPSPAIERVLVGIDHRSDADTLVRHGWRIARGLHAGLLVATVIEHSLAELPEHRRLALQRRLDLAQQLGAETIMVIGSNPGAVLAEIANARHATNVVIGRSKRSFWRRLLGNSVIDRLLQDVEGANVHIVTLDWVPVLQSKRKLSAQEGSLAADHPIRSTKSLMSRTTSAGAWWARLCP